jgi:hypothetical protein
MSEWHHRFKNWYEMLGNKRRGWIVTLLNKNAKRQMQEVVYFASATQTVTNDKN